MRKFWKSLGGSRIDRYMEVLFDRFITWERRLFEYKIELFRTHVFPEHIKTFILMQYVRPRGVGISSYDCVDYLKQDVINASKRFMWFKTTMEQTLGNRAINYDAYIEGNKTYDFEKNPFVYIVASGEENALLCYVTDSETSENGVIVRGYLVSDGKNETKMEKELLYDWCRILPMREEKLFRRFLKGYRNHLVFKGTTVAKINEETEFMINEFKKNTEYGNR